MGFEISQIKNQYLKDIATAADNNNDGTISNGSEVSVFLNKSKAVKDNGLCSEDEYINILNYCPRELKTVDGDKVQIGNKEGIVDAELKKQYLAELNAHIDNILKEKSLEKTPENIEKATEILKQRKELEVQIKIQETKIEKLKLNDPEKSFTAKKVIITSATTVCGGIGGALGGALLGSKVGILGGPIGIAAGALYGAIIGGVCGGATGIGIVKKTITPEEKEKAVKANQEEIKLETQKLEEFKTAYKSI